MDLIFDKIFWIIESESEFDSRINLENEICDGADGNLPETHLAAAAWCFLPKDQINGISSLGL